MTNKKDENKEIKETSLDKDNVEEKEKNIWGEIKRVYYFYKKHIDLLILILILSLILLYSSSNSKSLPKKLIGGAQISESEIANDLLWNNIVNVLMGYKILKDLKEKYPLSEGRFNYFIVYVGYIFIAFFVRPFKLIFQALIILFGVSGSFIFPFLLFGVMMYYVYKKMIKNKSPNPNDLFKENVKR